MSEEEAITEAWREVAHEIDAYNGYPDVQEDVLRRELARQALELVQPEKTEGPEKPVTKTTYVVSTEPQVLHIARTEPLETRVARVKELITSNTELHAQRMREHIGKVGLSHYEAADTVVQLLVELLGPDTEDGQILQKEWLKRNEEISHFGGRITLVKTAKVS